MQVLNYIVLYGLFLKAKLFFLLLIWTLSFLIVGKPLRILLLFFFRLVVKKEIIF